MFSQHVRITGARLGKLAAQKSASASIRGKRACLIGVHTDNSCTRHRSLSISCIQPCNSLPVLRASTRLVKWRPKSCNGRGQIPVIEDKRSFHMSLCARWSSYLPHLSCLLHRCTLTRQLGNTVYRDLHLAQGIRHHVPLRDLPSRADVRLLGRIKVHFKDSKGNPLKTIEANEGDNLLDIAHEYDIDLEGVYARIHRWRRLIECRCM